MFVAGVWSYLLVLRANRGFFDSVSSVGVGGQFAVGVFLRVVSVGSNLLSLFSQRVSHFNPKLKLSVMFSLSVLKVP